MEKNQEEQKPSREERDLIFESTMEWFGTHTFNYEEFSNLKELVDLKEKNKITISLAIPTLNEEKTIGNVIKIIKSELVDNYPLIDEMAVIDSSSTDNTRKVAEQAGEGFVKVYLADRHLKNEKIHYGKGENLWKSLYLLKGDIISWIDADIENINPRFVYGPIGVLLKNPKISYVKGFYQRPIIKKYKRKKIIFPTGGGRVTEIYVRPSFNTYFPELTGFIQPLSGEYAGRRKVLEQIPFYIGYGVETGMLIDILNKFGLNKMAQVDLIKRIHHNQNNVNLSKMSFGIKQVVKEKAIKLGRENWKSHEFIYPIYIDGKYQLKRQIIKEEKRKPIIEIPMYKKKFNQKA